jgi:hypothetical protein
MTSPSFLGIELRFRVDPRVVPWAHTIAGVLAWEPELAPTHLDRLSSADADGPEPWSDALWPELAHRCASVPGTAWTLSQERGRRSMTWVHRRLQVECSLAVPRPRGAAVKHLVALLAALESGVPPALAMAFDGDSRDVGLMTQGLHAVDELAPLVFLDRLTMERLVGPREGRVAPCEVVELEAGTVLVLRPDPFARRTREDARRAREVRRWLGIAPRAPLRIASRA